MTRPLTQRELALAATPFVAAPTSRQSSQDAIVPQFLIGAVIRGITFGICFAVFILLTDAFGIFTIVTATASPLTFILIFVFVSSL